MKKKELLKRIEHLEWRLRLVEPQQVPVPEPTRYFYYGNPQHNPHGTWCDCIECSGKVMCDGVMQSR